MSINEEIYSRYMYFNEMSLQNIRSTSAVHKMPDGSFYFNRASKEELSLDIKVNDERML